jgi:hypothetical protein
MKTSGSQFAQCLYFTTNALARKVEKLAIESWKETGLSPSHAYVLFAVLEVPGIQPSAVAEQLQLQASTITRLVQKLGADEAGGTYDRRQNHQHLSHPESKGPVPANAGLPAAVLRLVLPVFW